MKPHWSALCFSTALGCADAPTTAPPEPATIEAAISTTHQELVDYPRECSDAAYHCAPVFGGGSDCACEVPETGYALPGLEEVDIVMRQWLKHRDGGAATLAIRYKDRLIYKRGFGRTNGDYNAGGQPLVPPDSAMRIGSVSKNVVAAVARKLIDEKLEAEGMNMSAGDVPLLIDFDENDIGCGPGGNDCLLPEALHDAFSGAEDLSFLTYDLDLDPTEVGDDGYLCERVSPVRADASWQIVTVADLLGHTAGLPNSAPSATAVYDGIPAFRGYNSRAAFAAEDKAIRDAHPSFAGRLAQTRAYIGTQLGVPAGDVYFVNRYDEIHHGHTTDEVLFAVAGRCLASAPAGVIDADLADDANAEEEDGDYSNTLGAMMERIVTHLHPSERFTSLSGYPSLHDGSALQELLADDLGLAKGVETVEGMFGAQNVHGHDDISGWGLAEVVPRVWDEDSGSWYANIDHDLKRPWCVFHDNFDSCSFDEYASHASLRPPWDFALSGGKPAAVPATQGGWDITFGAGGLMSEMPVLALFADRFRFDGSAWKGMRTTDCTAPECRAPHGHNGALGGGYAMVYTLEDSFEDDYHLPPRDAEGRFTGIIGSAAWDYANPVEIALPAALTYAVALNQNTDPECSAVNDDEGHQGDQTSGVPNASCSYGTLGRMLRYALSRADWDAIDVALASEERLVQGMAMADANDASYLMADDRMIVRSGGPSAHKDAQTGKRIAMDLPSTRVGGNIVGAAYDDDRRLWTYYDDGRVSVAMKPTSSTSSESSGGAPAPLVLDALGGPVEFAIADHMRVRDILDVAITDGRDDTVAVAYYVNGTYSRGSPIDLALYGTAPYSVPPGQRNEDIVGVSMFGGDDTHVWVRYRDGSVSFGALGDLDSGGYWRGQIDDITIGDDGNTSIIYRSGFVRHLLGTLADNLPVKDAIGVGYDWLTLNDDVDDATEVLGVGVSSARSYILTADGTLSKRTYGSAERFPFAHGEASVPLEPEMNTVKPLKGVVGFAVSITWHWSWWADGTVTGGWNDTLDEQPWAPYTTAPGQTPASIVAMGMASSDTGTVWTLYRDGSVSAGTLTDLDALKYWRAPPVLIAK